MKHLLSILILLSLMTASISDAPKANIVLTPFGIKLNDKIINYKDLYGVPFSEFEKDEYPDDMNLMVFEVSPPQPNKHFNNYTISTACNDATVVSVGARSNDGRESAEELVNLNKVYDDLALKIIVKYGTIDDDGVYGNVRTDEYVEELSMRSVSIDLEKYNIFLKGTLDYDNKEKINYISITYESKKYDNGCLVDDTGL